VGQPSADLHLGADSALRVLPDVGLYASVESTFCISRDSGTLCVTRKLWWLAISKSYSINEISRFFERHYVKGNTLRMELCSGKKRTLTWSTKFSSLDGQVALLNHFLHVVRRHATNPPPAIHSSTNRILSENT
jgi:hypothetical protein